MPRPPTCGEYLYGAVPIAAILAGVGYGGLFIAGRLGSLDRASHMEFAGGIIALALLLSHSLQIRAHRRAVGMFEAGHMQERFGDPASDPLERPIVPRSLQPFDVPAPAPAFRLGCALDLGKGPLPVFPLLMREDWKRAPTQVARPIITGPKLPDIPHVALVHLIPEPPPSAPNRAFIRTERVESIGKTVRDFEEEALWNVAQRPGAWSIETPKPNVKIARFEGEYLAAERILDPAFLAQAHAALGSKQLLVGIPARGQLYATSLDVTLGDPAQALTFKLLIETLFAKGGELGITPHLFIVIDGKINSIAELASA
jgi:hypothetical protein